MNEMLQILAEKVRRHLAHSPRAPKYRCVRDALIELMAEGKLTEGARLPTEQVLAEALPVSLGTIQKALKELVDNGELVRKRRVGTIVGSGDHRREIGTPAFSFLRPDGSRVKMVFIRLLRRQYLRSTGHWAEVLGPCDEGYVQLVRQDRIDGAFDAYTEIYLRADLASSLMDMPVEQLEHESVLPLLQASNALQEFTSESRISRCRIPKNLKQFILPKANTKPSDEAAVPTIGLKLDIRYSYPDRSVFAWLSMTLPPNDYQIVIQSR